MQAGERMRLKISQYIDRGEGGLTENITNSRRSAKAGQVGKKRDACRRA